MLRALGLVTDVFASLSRSSLRERLNAAGSEKSFGIRGYEWETG